MERKFLLLSERSKKEVLNYMPNESSISKLALFFQNFSDGTRLKIISCLAMCDMCVNDISTILDVNQTTISHQLKYLKSQNIVSCRRDGKIILYSLTSSKVNDLMLSAVNVVQILLRHFLESLRFDNKKNHGQIPWIFFFLLLFEWVKFITTNACANHIV